MRTELRDGEKLTLKAKAHGLMLLGPIIVLFVYSIFYSQLTESGLANFVMLVLIAYLIAKILDWRSNLIIVTNKRVVHEHGILSISAKESPLEKINNVSFKQSMFGRVFNYGDIQIQSAAEMGATAKKFIKSPKNLKNTITQQMEDIKKEQIAQQAESMAKAIRDTQSTGNQIISDNTKECPYCAETIKLKAKICKHCGKDVE